MSQLVGTSQFGSNADTSLSVDQHYFDRQRIFYEPSPYSAFLAVVHQESSSPFLEWITALSSRPKYKKLTSAGHQLLQTFQSELRGQPGVLDTRYARWINSYPPSWHRSLFQRSSKTWKLVDSMLDSSLSISSTSLETIPNLGTWLAAVTWKQRIRAGGGDHLNMQMLSTIQRLQVGSTLWQLLNPPNTDAIENFRRKIKNSSHTCWDGHDPGWYASAISYLNNDNDPEFVPGPDEEGTCKECFLVEHARKFAKALSNSFHPGAELSTLSATMVSKQWR